MAHVRVRMYRQGIGDCFLLTFPHKPSPRHMLIDCGVLRGTENAAGTMERIAADIYKTTKGRIDVLVVTHEHWDHVSGFVQAKAQFSKLKFGEVWLAWTEDRKNDLAKQIRLRKERARGALQKARQRLRMCASPAAKASLSAMLALDNFDNSFGPSGTTTASAMQWAREKASRRVRYFSPSSGIVNFGDARIYVLGPPEDEKLLRKSNPSKLTPEVYQLTNMDLGFTAALMADDNSRPFDSSLQVEERSAKSDPFFRDSYYSGQNWRQIEEDWLGTAERLALQMDAHTNNTSLVLAIELRNGKVLLFPGDAQVGSWLSWEKLKWKVRDNDGDPAHISAKDLLSRTVLYKVGHHGSHNATLRNKGLEFMTSQELVAMIPVDEEKAKDLEWAMPFPSLLERLEEKTSGRVLRSDKDVALKERPKRRTEFAACQDYIDCFIET